MQIYILLEKKIVLRGAALPYKTRMKTCKAAERWLSRNGAYQIRAKTGLDENMYDTFLCPTLGGLHQCVKLGTG